MNKLIRLYIVIPLVILDRWCYHGKCEISNMWMSEMIPLHYKRYQAPANSITVGKIPNPIVVVSYVTPKFVTEISMKNMDFKVDLEILVEWYDNRLQLPTIETLEDSDNTLPQVIVEKMWYPSVYLDNCKGNGKIVTTPKDGVSGNINVGQLWTEAKEQNLIGMRVDYRKTFCFTCDLDFTAYPFDVQRCSIQLTWNYDRLKPVKVMFYTHDRERPSHSLIPVPPGFILASFVVTVHENDTSNPNSITELRSLTFTLHRVFGQHLMLVFFPSMLIVILSWLSFWLDVQTSAPRVALGLTSLLTLSTQFNAAQSGLPPVAKIKAIDIWMFTSIFMVFGSLIEFGIASVFFNYEKKSTDKPKVPLPPPKRNYVFLSSPLKRRMITVKTPRNIWCRRFCTRLSLTLRPRPASSKVDYAARIIFPAAYIIFNIWFWCYFYPKG